MITRTARSASACSKARCISASSACVSAFIRSGRLSVMVAMLLLDAVEQLLARLFGRLFVRPLAHSSSFRCCGALLGGTGDDVRRVRHDGFDRDIDRDHASLADDDGIEVERPEAARCAQSRIGQAATSRSASASTSPRSRPRAPSSSGAALMRWIISRATSRVSGAISVVVSCEDFDEDRRRGRSRSRDRTADRR